MGNRATHKQPYQRPPPSHKPRRYKEFDSVARNRFCDIVETPCCCEGTLYNAVEAETSKDVCLRVVSLNRLDCSFIDNISLLQKNQESQYVLKLYDVYETSDRFILITERAVDVLTWMGEKQRTRFDVGSVIEQLCQGYISLGLDLLLVPERVMIVEVPGDGFRVKFADLTPVDHVSNLATVCPSPDFVPPEILMGEAYEREPKFSWCLGALLYVLECGYPPFWGEDTPEIFRRIIVADFQFEEDLLNADEVDLVTKLIVVKASERLKMCDILRHPVVTKIVSDTQILAFLMATHPRCGARSPASCIPIIILQQIVSCIGRASRVNAEVGKSLLNYRAFRNQSITVRGYI
ncbi:hypothetical protein Pelo_2560 [Pelomyxa schiedti]|nr:hypothetical protein Pelo_2560 [Pelomyxa schiedti]